MFLLFLTLAILTTSLTSALPGGYGLDYGLHSAALLKSDPLVLPPAPVFEAAHAPIFAPAPIVAHAPILPPAPVFAHAAPFVKAIAPAPILAPAPVIEPAPIIAPAPIVKTLAPATSYASITQYHVAHPPAIVKTIVAAPQPIFKSFLSPTPIGIHGHGYH